MTTVPAGAAPGDAAVERIVAIHRRFADVLSRGDQGSIADFLTADTLLMPWGKPMVRGRADAVAFWSAATGDAQRRVKSRFEPEDWLIDGNVVVESGRAFISRVEEGREQPVDQGKYLVVWKQEDDRWRIHRDIFNSDTMKHR